MVDVKLLNSAAPPAAPPDEPAAAPPHLQFALEDQGAAVFRVPTVRDARAVERASKTKLSLTDFCRELGRACLVSWGEAATLPDEDEIYASEDQELVRLMLQELSGAEDPLLDDNALVDLFMGQAEGEQRYEVTPDRQHRIELSLGCLTLRRLTRKDIRRIEGASSSKTDLITGDVLTAVSACADWWRSDRAIMPADFDPLPLREFRAVSEALKGFLRRPNP